MEACNIRFDRHRRDFGVEEASLLSGKGGTHHRGGGGVGSHIGTSFTSEVREDFVDMLMGGVSRGVGAGAGDQMTAVDPQYHRVFIANRVPCRLSAVRQDHARWGPQWWSSEA